MQDIINIKMTSLISFPKVQLSLTLALIYLSNLLLNSTQISYLLLIFNCLLFCVGFDLFFTYLRRRTLFIPYAAVASAFIIALIVDPNISWLGLVAVCALAMGSKNFLRISGRHLFNPAGFGLIAGGILLNLSVSWWGVSHQYLNILNPKVLIAFLILISPIVVSALRMKRYGSIFTFLITYNLIFLILKGQTFSLANFLDPTVVFFSLVMLPEPMTSPVALKRQILYGIFVAIFSYLPVGLLQGLLIGNLAFFKYR